MAYVLLIIALVAAGVYTENAAFYWVAGGVGIIVTFLPLLALFAFAKIKNQIDRDFKKFPRF